MIGLGFALKYTSQEDKGKGIDETAWQNISC